MEGQNVSVIWKDNTKVKDISADALIMLISQSDLATGSYSKEWTPILKQLSERKLFNAESSQIHALPLPGNGSGSQRTVILVGTGDRPMSSEELRHAAASAARAALKIQAKQLAWEVPLTMQKFTMEQNTVIAAQAISEGFILGSYRMKHYKQHSSPYKGIKQLLLFRTDAAGAVESDRWEQGIKQGLAYAEATCLARDLTNMPSNMLVPGDLAQAALEVAEKYGMESSVLDEEELNKLGMGGLLAVGKGSIHPPRMIVIKYQGTEQWDGVIGLVGKGITFDTGGISLKKRQGMEDMISDMGGAAAVLGVMQALGVLKPSINVVMVIPTAENMPAGNAYKPGDVITTLSGRTVEVLNTDAEGRVVLADGLTYAKQLGAERLLDVATLTGAVLSALGDVATGLVTNDEVLQQEFILASKRSGEKVWPFPSYDEYWDLLKSDVADLRNSTGPKGAVITAGLFIGTFAEGVPWLHLDIAGTAFLQKERGVNPKGASGVMVRTILEWILAQEATKSH
ncbi:leucyl aminopeptidase [Paenibacillus pini]|uniref:Probable cytosol aminopeptidase n=1 Tax=Paenibacillus pini JCM 16418 TaxID=1236976 RepID=W7YNG1_9BACL|nr:leucyl aminopeptidase [Paenibacillus pini]GAF06171.1 cytosol aminopeptidase PepA [Paenibacillus pini JCM 16418]